MNVTYVPRHAALAAGSSVCPCGNDAEKIVRLGDAPALHRLCCLCVDEYDLVTEVYFVGWINAA